MKFLEKVKKSLPIGNEPIGEIESTVDVPEEVEDEEELIEDEVLVEPEEDKDNTDSESEEVPQSLKEEGKAEKVSLSSLTSKFSSLKGNIKTKTNINKENKDTKKESKFEQFTQPTKVSFAQLTGKGFKKEERQINTNSMMLNVLGIREKLDTSMLEPISTFEDVEFHQVAPVGIDISEVERYVDRSNREIKKLYILLENRQKDFEKLYKEALRLESKVIEYQHDNQLTNSILDSKEKEDRLKEQVVELRLENQRLKSQLEKKEHTKTLPDI